MLMHSLTKKNHQQKPTQNKEVVLIYHHDTTHKTLKHL